MKKIITKNGTIFSEKVDRSPATDDYVVFATYLNAIGVQDFSALSRYHREKIFREYQCFCAYLNVNYESPKKYGLRGLFG